MTLSNVNIEFYGFDRDAHRQVDLGSVDKEYSQVYVDQYLENNCRIKHEWHWIVPKPAQELAFKNDKTQAVMTLRGKNLYFHETCATANVKEWLLGAIFIIWFPLMTLLKKIVVPIVVFPVVLLLSTCMQLKEETVNEAVYYWKNLVPLKSFVGLIIHPILAVLALIPFASNFFNKMNGDVERWINGHLNETQKPFSERVTQVFYCAMCQQPRIILREKPHIGANHNISQREFIRCLGNQREILKDAARWVFSASVGHFIYHQREHTLTQAQINAC